MKKYLIHIILTLSFLLPFTGYAACSLDETSSTVFLAECSKDTIGIKPSIITSGEEGVRERIKLIANAAISLGALLAVGAIVYAGMRYTSSYGDDEKLKKAKTTGIYALIGLLLMMASFGLVDIIINSIYKIAAGPGN